MAFQGAQDFLRDNHLGERRGERSACALRSAAAAATTPLRRVRMHTHAAHAPARATSVLLVALVLHRLRTLPPPRAAPRRARAAVACAAAPLLSSDQRALQTLNRWSTVGTALQVRACLPARSPGTRMEGRLQRECTPSSCALPLLTSQPGSFARPLVAAPPCVSCTLPHCWRALRLLRAARPHLRPTTASQVLGSAGVLSCPVLDEDGEYYGCLSVGRRHANFLSWGLGPGQRRQRGPGSTKGSPTAPARRSGRGCVQRRRPTPPASGGLTSC
jgi:hypothetical protein